MPPSAIVAKERYSEDDEDRPEALADAVDGMEVDDAPGPAAENVHEDGGEEDEEDTQDHVDQEVRTSQAEEGKGVAVVAQTDGDVADDVNDGDHDNDMLDGNAAGVEASDAAISSPVDDTQSAQIPLVKGSRSGSEASTNAEPTSTLHSDNKSPALTSETATAEQLEIEETNGADDTGDAPANESRRVDEDKAGSADVQPDGSTMVAAEPMTTVGAAATMVVVAPEAMSTISVGSIVPLASPHPGEKPHVKATGDGGADEVSPAELTLGDASVMTAPSAGTQAGTSGKTVSENSSAAETSVPDARLDGPNDGTVVVNGHTEVKSPRLSGDGGNDRGGRNGDGDGDGGVDACDRAEDSRRSEGNPKVDFSIATARGVVQDVDSDSQHNRRSTIGGDVDQDDETGAGPKQVDEREGKSEVDEEVAATGGASTGRAAVVIGAAAATRVSSPSSNGRAPKEMVAERRDVDGTTTGSPLALSPAATVTTPAVPPAHTPPMHGLSLNTALDIMVSECYIWKLRRVEVARSETSYDLEGGNR